MEQKERIKTAFSIVQKVKDLDEEVRKIEAVIYAMAEKFLDSMELDEVKEEIRMTRLGQMLVNEGISEGYSQGIKALKYIKIRLFFESASGTLPE